MQNDVTTYIPQGDVDQMNSATSNWLTYVNGAQILSRDSFFVGAEDLRTIKAFQKTLEDKRTKITGPLNESLRSINDLFRDPMAQLKAAESGLKVKLGNFERQEREREEAERKAAQRKADEEKAELARRAAKAEAQGKVEKAQELAARAQEVQVAAPAIVPVKAAGTSFGEKWEFEIIDGTQLPIEFLVPNLAKIGQTVRAMKSVDACAKLLGPGVRVWSSVQVSARAK